MSKHLLETKQLRLGVRTKNGHFNPVDGVDLNLSPGRTLALLGESGCGKSLTGLALMQLLPMGVSVYQESRIQAFGQDLLGLPEIRYQQIRGRRIAMIFQEPMTSLNPVIPIGEQIAEVIRQHKRITSSEMKQHVITLMKEVGIAEAKQRYAAFPHQISGGMKQRVMLAMAIACEPEILIADEPTTALDVTIQRQILALLKTLQKKTGMAILFITHDLAVARQIADDIAVMYAGEIVECAKSEVFFNQPLHPYSQGLLASHPGRGKRKHTLPMLSGNVSQQNAGQHQCRFLGRCPHVIAACSRDKPAMYKQGERSIRCFHYVEQMQALAPPDLAQAPIARKTAGEVQLTLNQLKVYFPVKSGLFRRQLDYVRAVDGISFSLKSNTTLAIVGESGCGKTTLAHSLLQLIQPTAGEILLRGQSIHDRRGVTPRSLSREIQMVFQDPYSSMNPRMTVFDILAEGIRANGLAKEKALPALIDALLRKVGLTPEVKHRYPHQFSGGQRQRICIARALSVKPKIIICDEPTSALDVSVQAQILNLLQTLQANEGIAFLFITHDISVVRYCADEVAVMYLGRIVEYGQVETLLTKPMHPYTKALLSAVPQLRTQTVLPTALPHGEPPSPIHPPTGCHFHPRCPHAKAICREQYPKRLTLNNGHQVRCHLI